jgi:hypothetical protein
MLAFGVSSAWANYDRAAYWDESYPTNWADRTVAAAVKDALSAAGYTILNAAQLKTWMDGHIADEALSVLVFCNDIAPDTVVETNTASCTLRQYLDKGGKIIFYADIPFYNQGHGDNTNTNWAMGGSTGILGFSAADGGWGSNNTVTFTEAGIAWGLTETWNSQRPNSLAVIAAENLTVLATDNDGEAAAWVKHYLTGDTYRGFLYTRDVGGMPNVGDLMRLAEYIPYTAGSPDPADGSSVGPEVWPPNVYLILDYTPGVGAITHTAYFSDVEQEVIDRLSSRSLGSVPPWPAVTETGFVVGYDDPGIPEYARTPLVAGKTYYWCIDEDCRRRRVYSLGRNGNVEAG